MRVPRLSPQAYRRVTLLAAIMLAVIIVTGGAVRLTDSGLGCPSWPNCEEGRLVPRTADDSHAMVEFVNRVFTGFVSISVILAVFGSLLRVPRRRDLVWLSLGLAAGVFAQAVLGGLTVLFHLKPQFVMAHFQLSIVLLTNAIVLYARAGQPDEATDKRRVVSARVAAMCRGLLVVASVVLVTGTVVTGTGPHSGGGSTDDVQRLDLSMREVVRVHSTTVLVFLGLVLATLVLVWRDRAPVSVRTRLTVLLGVLVAQAGVGYAQYFSDIPPLLVGIHIAGATAVWSTTLWLALGCFERIAPARVERRERSGAPSLVSTT